MGSEEEGNESQESPVVHVSDWASGWCEMERMMADDVIESKSSAGVWVLLTAFNREDLEDLSGTHEGVFASREAAERYMDSMAEQGVLHEHSVDAEGAQSVWYRMGCGWALAYTTEVES